MEKFGVERDNEKMKEASKGAGANTCPRCGKKLESDGQVCPDHGTEPFEKKPPPPKKE